MFSRGWGEADLPDLSGRTVVVTGANSGIGLTASRALARAGARVVLAVRDLERGAQAAASIDGKTDVLRLDLADLSSVRAFAAGWSGGIDVLVNNAGLMAVPEARTADGFEMQIGVNHLGHFALTNLLLERVRSRVVTISSVMHRAGRIDLEDLNWERRDYDRWKAYGQSKLANLLFTAELQRRLGAAGSDVLAVAAHPGYAATNLQNRTGSWIQNAGLWIGNKVIAQSDRAGALPTLFAATAEMPPAGYAGPSGPRESRGAPALVGRTEAASDMETARALWELSEDLTAVRFPL